MRVISGANISRKIQGSIMFSLNLLVFRSEDDVSRDMRDTQAVRLVNSGANGELGNKDFGICQHFSESLAGCLGQSQELVEGDPGWDVGQLVDDVKAEGLGSLNLFWSIKGSIISDLLWFL